MLIIELLKFNVRHSTKKFLSNKIKQTKKIEGKR